jgi:hypothetical protein
MTNIKTFNTVGVSRQFGKIKIRMANDIEWRQFMLTKEGHVDILLVNLGEQVSKEDAVLRAMELPEFENHEEAQAVFHDYLVKAGVLQKPKKKRGRPAKAVAAAPEADAEVTESTLADTLAEVAELAEAAADAPALEVETVVEAAEFEPNF